LKDFGDEFLWDFAPDCGNLPKMIAPMIDAQEKELAGKLIVGKINVDKNQMIASRFHPDADYFP
jgi:thioredoxin-like negative regulator of GroEL